MNRMNRPWTAYALNVLKDFEEHPREKLVQEMMVFVPTNTAFQKAEKHRMHRHKNPDGSPMSPDDKPRLGGDAVLTGQRMTVNSSLDNMRRSGIIILTPKTVQLIRFPAYYKPDE